VEVVKPYASQYPDPIRFDPGASVLVGREDPDCAGWFWCQTSSGKEGWVHRSFLAASTGATKSIGAYSARELTVTGGERGALIHALDGWALVRLDSGDEGWLPSSHVRPAAV
jgi:hypothetical protein